MVMMEMGSAQSYMREAHVFIDIVEAVEQFGSLFIQVYGQGECPMGITVLPRFEVQIETLKNGKTFTISWLRSIFC